MTLFWRLYVHAFVRRTSTKIGFDQCILHHFCVLSPNPRPVWPNNGQKPPKKQKIEKNRKLHTVVKSYHSTALFLDYFFLFFVFAHKRNTRCKNRPGGARSAPPGGFLQRVVRLWAETKNKKMSTKTGRQIWVFGGPEAESVARLANGPKTAKTANFLCRQQIFHAFILGSYKFLDRHAILPRNYVRCFS